MDLEVTVQAQKDLAALPSRIKTQAHKQLALLCDNLRHPSIQAKKYEGTDDIWQGRVNRNYRFYFRIVESTYRILRIIPHPK